MGMRMKGKSLCENCFLMLILNFHEYWISLTITSWVLLQLYVFSKFLISLRNLIQETWNRHLFKLRKWCKGNFESYAVEMVMQQPARVDFDTMGQKNRSTKRGFHNCSPVLHPLQQIYVKHFFHLHFLASKKRQELFAFHLNFFVPCQTHYVKPASQEYATTLIS